jgi:tetratricopeptide (TPR) repeat protein
MTYLSTNISVCSKQADVKSKQMMADICYEIGKVAENRQDSEQALASYNEALQYYDLHKKTLVSLAKIYKLKGDASSCQHLCSKMIQRDLCVDEAALIMADLDFVASSYEESARHFMAIVLEDLTNFMALLSYLQLMQRHGKLDEAKTVFEKIESNPIMHLEAGYHYCKGFYYQ